MKTKSNVYVLYTGGTLGMIPDGAARDAPLRPMSLTELTKILPAADAPGLRVTLDALPVARDSSSLAPDDWLAIASRVAGNLDACDGCVVVHGTDTMAWTASALAFMLQGLGKPVIFTGSMRPLVAARSDAPANYRAALRIAGWRATDLPRLPEVAIAFGDRVVRGCRARKLSAGARSAFRSPNLAPLGRLSASIRLYPDRFRPIPGPEAPTLPRHAPARDIRDLTLYPGLSAGALAAALAGARGLVLRAYGAGNAPDDPDLLAVLRDAIDGGLVAVAVSQCPHGRVDMGLYAAGRGLAAAGVASGFDMTPEAAFAKLTVLLGAHDPATARRLMQTNLAGELTPPPELRETGLPAREGALARALAKTLDAE